eukprot:3574235-Rhodomonas_salina.1
MVARRVARPQLGVAPLRPLESGWKSNQTPAYQCLLEVSAPATEWLTGWPLHPLPKKGSGRVLLIRSREAQCSACSRETVQISHTPSEGAWADRGVHIAHPGGRADGFLANSCPVPSRTLGHDKVRARHVQSG